MVAPSTEELRKTTLSSVFSTSTGTHLKLQLSKAEGDMERFHRQLTDLSKVVTRMNDQVALMAEAPLHSTGPAVDATERSPSADAPVTTSKQTTSKKKPLDRLMRPVGADILVRRSDAVTRKPDVTVAGGVKKSGVVPTFAAGANLFPRRR